MIIGGTLLTGGRGTIIGSLLGVLVFTTITNLFVLNNLATEVQNIAKGAIIVAAVLLQSSSPRPSSARRRPDPTRRRPPVTRRPSRQSAARRLALRRSSMTDPVPPASPAAGLLVGGARRRRRRRRSPPAPATRRTPTPRTTARPAPPPATNAAPGKQVTIGFSAPAADHGWIAAITNNAKAQAAAYSDVAFKPVEPTNDVDPADRRGRDADRAEATSW